MVGFLLTSSEGASVGRKTPYLAVVIPALNEAGSIEEVVRQVSQRALVIVIDDGSDDNTALLARAAGAYVVSHPINRGYDGALETGFETAISLGCTLAVTMDADGQHDPAMLNHFIVELEAGADLVVGRRDRRQRWSEILFCEIARRVWGLDDPLCGMKGYRLSALEKIHNLNSYQSIGTELAIRLIVDGARVSQFNIKTRRRHDVSRFGANLKADLRICYALWVALVKSRCWVVR